MLLARFVACLALAAHAGLVSASDASAEPIAWRESVFSIPYRINRAPSAHDAPVKVELWFSEDDGQHWSLFASTEPELEGSFAFRAPRDGQYQFALRAIDRHGRAVPQGPLHPELSVMVDTVPPRLDLTATAGEAGQVQIAWQVTDENLKSESLAIHVKPGPEKAWQELAIRKASSGSAAWVPPQGCTSVSIRVLAHDRAGNPANRQTEVTITPASQANTPASVANAARSVPDHPPLDNQSPDARLPAPPENPTAQIWTAEAPSQRPIEHWLHTEPSTQSGRTDFQSVPAPIAQSREAGLITQTPSTTTNSERGLDGPPESLTDQVRVLNTLTFDVEYDAAMADASSIGQVELWGTRDGGLTWSSYGMDTDGHSPIRVQAEREGWIGLRMVMAQPGTLNAGPARGDAAELWVQLDVTPPEATLVAVEQAAQGPANYLIIEWQAKDENLVQRPVSLLRSQYADGPWLTIASALENNGRFTWLVDPTVPDQFHLRIEVRDAAGNMGAFQTAHPIYLRRPARRGRILDVRPVNAP